MTVARVALVTGSTRGVGLAIARRLGQDGCRIALNYRADEAGAHKAVAALQALCPQVVALRADVADPAAARGLVEDVHRRFGRLDVLVNNAGPFLSRPAIETTDEEWRAMLDANLGSAFSCTREALKIMRQAGGGCIVNIGALNVESSPVGVFEAPAYYAAKAGLMMLTRQLARSEAPWGIRVNAVNPGFIETEAYGAFDEADKADWAKMIPLGRFGRPEEVAEAVSFLASERAAYTTGAILHVHGGLFR